MFSVLFEVQPRAGKQDDYLANAKILRPDLEGIDGFLTNIRYKSLQRERWILSYSTWRDEKAVVRWRTQARHHGIQEVGRTEIFEDYHLRVGELEFDSGVPASQGLPQQRFDVTAAGSAPVVSLVTAKRPKTFAETTNPADCSMYLGLNPYADGMISWDVFEAVLTPGDLIMMLSWRDAEAAKVYEDTAILPADGRMQRVRVIRDYGMYDRREAPQFYPDAPGRKTIHS